jgi:hypothetical protein
MLLASALLLTPGPTGTGTQWAPWLLWYSALSKNGPLAVHSTSEAQLQVLFGSLYASSSGACTLSTASTQYASYAAFLFKNAIVIVLSCCEKTALKAACLLQLYCHRSWLVDTLETITKERQKGRWPFLVITHHRPL